jgi:hypothetical protein
MCAEAEEIIEHRGFNTDGSTLTGKIKAWFLLRMNK